MLKEQLKNMLNEKVQARAQMQETMAGTEDKETRGAQLEIIRGLDAEIEKFEEMIARCDDTPETDPDLEKRAKQSPVGGLKDAGAVVEKDNKNVLEERGAKLRAGEAITVPSMPSIEERALTIETGIVVETKYSRELNPTFNEVSSLIDGVNSIPLQGGEAYVKGFVVNGGEGDYTAEGADASDIDIKYDYVTVGKSKITAYAEVTKEIKKLPNINYAAYVSDEVRKAIRKKITRQIIAGAGTADTITGIYNAPANVIPADYDLPLAGIDENTLNAIVFAYGGDEDVEDGAVLVLSKKDLQAFANLRNANLEPVYTVTKRGNSGTIKYAKNGTEVEYILNSACNSLSTATTAVPTMVYGRLGAYEMPIFSDIEIEESREYKFKQGIIAFRGEAYVGGNVAAYKGWMRIKKQIAG